jgi:hypothetical protein
MNGSRMGLKVVSRLGGSVRPAGSAARLGGSARPGGSARLGGTSGGSCSSISGSWNRRKICSRIGHNFKSAFLFLKDKNIILMFSVICYCYCYLFLYIPGCTQLSSLRSSL